MTHIWLSFVPHENEADDRPHGCHEEARHRPRSASRPRRVHLLGGAGAQMAHGQRIGGWRGPGERGSFGVPAAGR